jgi:predicted acyl esterase
VRVKTRILQVGVILLVLLSLFGTARAEGSPKERAEALGLTCRTLTGASSSLIRCDGPVKSFDQIPLDVTVSLPTSGSAPFPTILQLGGWPGGKLAMTDTACGVRVDCDPYWPEVHHWNEVWFTQRGYASITYEARGFKKSCGPTESDPACVSGYTRLADSRYEVRDSQYLLGVLVDAWISDASRLAATGESYGGGQTWRLAVSMPWSSPVGVPLQLAAAIPTKPWTDLHGALVPNGRATSEQDQSASHEEPFGVPKSAYVAGFYEVGLNDGGGPGGSPRASGRYDHASDDLGSNFSAVLAFWSAGDPFDPTISQKLTQAWRLKSAYYADEYLNALHVGTVDPVPTFAISGWTDPLFPAVESMQMYRKLRAADPAYPITLAFADAGHDAYHVPIAEWRALSDLANAFLDAHVLGSGVAPQGITSFQTTCPAPTTLAPPVVAPSLDALASSSLKLLGGSASLAWTPARDDPASAPPVAGLINGLQCPVATTPARETTSSYKKFPMSSATTMIGLPVFEADYALIGRDGILAVKMWDRAPDGKETLVTRGVYRIALDVGDTPAGKIRFQLNGNHWRFPAGHEIVLEIASSDAPYLRPNNQAFSLELSTVRVTVPTA